jgi:hypothetical protein
MLAIEEFTTELFRKTTGYFLRLKILTMPVFVKHQKLFNIEFQVLRNYISLKVVPAARAIKPISNKL